MFLFIFLNILYYLFINYLSQNAGKFKTIMKDLENLLLKCLRSYYFPLRYLS